MLSPLLRSIVYASEGLWHAIATERNLKIFSAGVVFSLVCALFFRIQTIDWILVLLSGGVFLSAELINTSLERLSSAFYRHVEDAKDTHKHRGAMKETKDVAAAASLVLAIVWAATMLIIFWPYFFEFLVRAGFRIG